MFPVDLNEMSITIINSKAKPLGSTAQSSSLLTSSGPDPNGSDHRILLFFLIRSRIRILTLLSFNEVTQKIKIHTSTRFLFFSGSEGKNSLPDSVPYSPHC